ncbi:alcohol dehydrogenase catalytic domain-containing protein [Streptomyces phaeoluteigriseus]
MPLRHDLRRRHVRPAAGQPARPGHEIVGRVTETGPDVTRRQVGDLVDIGCMVNACRT